MTLADWTKQYALDPVPYGKSTVAQYVYLGAQWGNKTLCWDLHHLSDYVITSAASGPGYVICPRLSSFTHTLREYHTYPEQSR